MKILTRHNSPDGALTLLVVEGESWRSVGFADGRDDTPRTITSDHLSRPSPEAIREFVSDVLAGRLLLAIVRGQSGNLTDVFVVDQPRKALAYARPDQSIQLRYWDGTEA